MWSDDQVFAFGISGVGVGGAIGALFGLVSSVVGELSLPSGPSFGVTPVVVAAGGFFGLLVGFAAAAGGTLAILASSRSTLSAARRAAMVGLAAGAGALLASWLVFGQGGFVDPAYLIAGSTIIATVVAAGSAAACERKQSKPFHPEV